MYQGTTMLDGSTPPNRLSVQGDGNIVVYSGADSSVLYTSGTTDVTRLVFQQNRSLVAYSAANSVVWSSATSVVAGHALLTFIDSTETVEGTNSTFHQGTGTQTCPPPPSA